MAFSLQVAAQSIITGTVSEAGRALEGVVVGIPSAGIMSLTGPDGTFTLPGLSAGEVMLTVSFLGYKPIQKLVNVEGSGSQTIHFELLPDLLQLNQVVVSATRNEIPIAEAPVIVNTISSRTFETTQSLSLSEGLSFSPGLRVENNCSNCGFSQLRINGMEGAYTQILINSRPVFSALAGVYGLDMIPSSMVDRVEVVRGGGSVLYGGNAIAGTVNVITRDPIENTLEVSLNQAYTDLSEPDRTLLLSGSLVSDNFKKGISFYGAHRDRDAWDANGDGFSEMTVLENYTLGFDAYFNPTQRSKIKAGAYGISEFRRGGSDFELKPHESRLAEQLEHQLLGFNTSYELYSPDYRHKYAFYISSQFTERQSYYGSGGRIIPPGEKPTDADLIAMNAYGESDDAALAAGAQYALEVSEQMSLTAGSELLYNNVNDQMPGYGRSIVQRVTTLGNYAQLEWKKGKRLTLVGGGRFDMVFVNGQYFLSGESLNQSTTLPVFVPRLAAMFEIAKGWQARASYAQGYRAPQAFDEDLHIETVGGAVRFVRLSPDLVSERSNNFSGSIGYTKDEGRVQLSFLAEAFYTLLLDPFILEDINQLSQNIQIIEKRNGSGAVVQGINLEANVAISRKWLLQSGGTILSGKYDKPLVLWTADEDDADQRQSTSTTNLLRTPNYYGFATVQWSPAAKFSVSTSAVYTGRMYTPHVVDNETAFINLVHTPRFLENNIRLSWTQKIKKKSSVEFFAGMQNIFNSFQQDFDTGPLRDGSFVYGPMRPRTVFFGVKFSLNG
jgi:outer membrane receptor for ferrienterochelin and colicins